MVEVLRNRFVSFVRAQQSSIGLGNRGSCWIAPHEPEARCDGFVGSQKWQWQWQQGGADCKKEGIRMSE